MEETEEIPRLWKCLHHFFLGLIILFMGIISLIFNYCILQRDRNLGLYTIVGLLFVLGGVFLIIDDILAEIKGISVFKRITDLIKLKKWGIIFLCLVSVLFIFLLYIRFFILE
ncbi:MAG: hypothetical protein ACFFAN_00895 [Promethearchaeota archaeon]